MSMCLAMCTLSDGSIRKVLTDPPLVWKIIAPDDPEIYEAARAQPIGFIARLFGRKQAPVSPPVDLPLTPSEVESTDLDKAWHGIHYMLTGTDWKGEGPLAFLVHGGDAVGDIDVGYGPARAFASAEVQAINATLMPIDEAFLKQRFNPGEMMKLSIYPEIWDRDPKEDDTFSYCIDNFNTMKAFVANAAQNNKGLLVYLS